MAMDGRQVTATASGCWKQDKFIDRRSYKPGVAINEERWRQGCERGSEQNCFTPTLP